MLTEARAREIVAAVEAKNQAFHCLDLQVRDGKATVRFVWTEAVEPRQINVWFRAAGAQPMLVGRVLQDGAALVDYGVLRFTEAR